MRLLLCGNFPPGAGGSQTWSFEVARHLQKLGHEVTFLARKAEGWRAFDSACPFPVERASWKIRLYGKFRSILKKKGIEKVLVTHRADFAAAARMLALPRGVPYVVVSHGGEILKSHRTPSVLKNFPPAAGIIAVSNFTKGLLVELGIEAGKVTVIPNGTDAERFSPDVDGSETRARYAPNGQKVVFTISRLVKRKGHVNLMKAIASLEGRHDMVYVIGGAGEEESNLRSLAKELGIEEKVKFAGRIPDEELPKYYAACDVFAMPNRYVAGEMNVEGFGIVFLEAGAAGRPVIGGNSGGTPDAIADGETGYLVDPDGVPEIAEALGKLLSNPELAEKMGKAGHERVVNGFTWMHAAGRIAKVLAEAKS
ncbi:MAG: glycosyltransferase family 4 protein [Planctomycetota bacterium]|jgi:phosphatidylinositol alpha-1,6-mannosyltransferase